MQVRAWCGAKRTSKVLVSVVGVSRATKPRPCGGCLRFRRSGRCVLVGVGGAWVVRVGKVAGQGVVWGSRHETPTAYAWVCAWVRVLGCVGVW